MIINTDPITIITHCKTCGAPVELSPNAAAYASRGIMCRDCMRVPQRQRMTTELYHEYLQTEHWQGKRREALDRAGHRCQVCAKTERLDVHHNFYGNLGGEPLVDLVVLCRWCHELFHGVV